MQRLSDRNFFTKIGMVLNNFGEYPDRLRRQIISQRVIEFVKVDFLAMEERMLVFVRLANNGEATKEDYRNAFYKLWLDNAPPGFVKILKDSVEKKISGALEFQKLIIEMGDKAHTLQNNSRICVSIEIPPIPCKECYFVSICKLVAQK